MKYPIYTVDAFTTQRFRGNPAAVLLSREVLHSSQMHEIAAELNLSETAFPVPRHPEETFESARVFNVRYFSPKIEVALCGHATLSTAHVLFNEIDNVHSSLDFHTKGGVVLLKRHQKGVEMDFPAHAVKVAVLKWIENARKELFEQFEAPPFLSKLVRLVVPSDIAIRSVVLASANRKLIVEIDPTTTKEQFLSLNPDTHAMMQLHPSGELILGVVLTFAPLNPVLQGFNDEKGLPYDYVSRFFAPWMGIREDPATGSSQCSLGPYWATILDKQELYAFQCFPGRGAQFYVTVGAGESEGRVAIVGSSLTVIRGEMEKEEEILHLVL